jgi:hypothetical protein
MFLIQSTAMHAQILWLTVLEALWIEIKIERHPVLIGGFYRPPDANLNYFNLIEESFDRVLNTQYSNIVIAGDFNLNLLSTSTCPNKLQSIYTSYGYYQLSNQPTHFTEKSNSFIDLLLVNNPHSFMTSIVNDPFIPDLTRYNCPIVLVLKFKNIRHILSNALCGITNWVIITS